MTEMEREQRNPEISEQDDCVTMALLLTPQLPKDPMQASEVLRFMGAFHKCATELRASIAGA